MHPDFGGDSGDPDAPIYGMPYVVVAGTQPLVPVVFDYDEESLGEHDPEALELVTLRELGWDYLPDRKLRADDQTLSVSLMALSAVTVVAE